MTDKELVERLNAYSAQYQNHGGITAEAADRIEQLCAELTNEKIDNTNLIGELATVAAERDRYKEERDALMEAVRGKCSLCKYYNYDLLDDNCPCLNCEYTGRKSATGKYWKLIELEGNT